MIVIGAGRVGGALASRARDAGRAQRLVDRSDGWDALDGPAGTPIVVAVRNDDLAAVVAKTPPHRHGDLVFVQNGMLRPWLEGNGLADATRGLLFFAVASRGAPLVPGGMSPFMGPHAAKVVEALTALAIPAEVATPEAFGAVELEKLIWNSAFGLLCERFSCDVGTVCDAHHDALQTLVNELAAVGAAGMDVDLDRGPLLERLVAYSRSIASYRGAVKELKWRNGWFVLAGREHGIPTPSHDALLDATGHLDAALNASD